VIAFQIDPPPRVGYPRSSKCEKVIKTRSGRRACLYPSAGGQALALGDLKKEDGREYYEFFQVARKHFAPLRGCFGRYGSLEMHGCQIGRGNKGNTLVGLLCIKSGYKLRCFQITLLWEKGGQGVISDCTNCLQLVFEILLPGHFL
jgi:hypothetical protein